MGLLDFFRGFNIEQEGSFKLKIKKRFMSTIFIIAPFILLFIVLWLFDDNTKFSSDYIYPDYEILKKIRWSWHRKGINVITILSFIISIILCFVEILGYFDKYTTPPSDYFKNHKCRIKIPKFKIGWTKNLNV